MGSRLKLHGHPLHPLLVILPLSLFVTAVIFDFADLIGGPTLLGETAYWNIVAGLIGGVLAALAGLVDYLAIPGGTRAKRVGTAHVLLNAAVMVLFAISWLVRMGTESHSAGGGLFTLEFVAMAVGGVSAWLGGELAATARTSELRPAGMPGLRLAETPGLRLARTLEPIAARTLEPRPARSLEPIAARTLELRLPNTPKRVAVTTRTT